MVVPFNGRNSLKQYKVSKTTKQDFKSWVRFGVSGNVYEFEPYQGISGCTQTSEHDVIGDVVIRLCHGLKKKTAKVYFDNFFPSITLVEKLGKENIYSFGILHANTVGDAANKLVRENEMKKKDRGSASYATSEEGITAMWWKDNSRDNNL
ncbi:hypothetical protein QYM36_006236 [Artemia franciscana]|uniref:PiggyBac transposable element-derived protein domain-containing protein n=1 Tax=Artemia franciscana TaxID=6661 RepID=A0AA88HWZ7_ARTSF|nr:hypothetical protein QYM36_006236 [Artemia franciscana]